MDENKKEVIEIRSEDKDFFAEFIDCEGPIIQDSIDHKKITLALDKAHDIRKFEIDLYWKRATYFFAFFTVVTAAFGFTFSNYRYTSLSPAIAIIGMTFSQCFFHVNIGSKYWQENWEFIIDKIEYYVTGNLYKVSFFEDHNTLRPSVSKINIYLSCFIKWIWVCSLFLSIFSILFPHPIYSLVYSLVAFKLYKHTEQHCKKTFSDELTNDKKIIRRFHFRNPTYKK
ncbi:hypothetical protein ACXEKA_004119 [Klebsiella pneumoniae]